MCRRRKCWWFTWKLIRKCTGITIFKGGKECAAGEIFDDLHENLLESVNGNTLSKGGIECAAGENFDDLHEICCTI